MVLKCFKTIRHQWDAYNDGELINSRERRLVKFIKVRFNEARRDSHSEKVMKDSPEVLLTAWSVYNDRFCQETV